MRIVLQRVAEASVNINGNETRSIGQGFVILVGIEDADTNDDAIWLANKIANLRVFSDDKGKMNHSAIDVNGQLLIISQFTLHASTKKGNRPSYIKAAKPDKAIPLYEYFVERCKEHFPARVQTGEFGADMKVSLVNDGPVTICIDTQNKE
ncbi:D-aminoacyl-tRNA deacylase [Owenweeksia hongkongensis]|uniref:D-aminoacyl-tRNA deacylase n=1 Tax=Owenweeksia hongkongensis TaxID=253245 RepID=UPI003A8D4A78